jgi:rRNA-processing protein FCF1
MKILIDTNFILSALRFKIKMPYDNLIIPTSVINELEKIAKGKSKDAALARMALQLIEKKTTVVRTSGSTDKAILNYAVANNCAVATNDRNLIKELKANGIKVIRIRQKKYIVEE